MQPQVCWHRRELSEAVANRKDDVRCVVAAGGDGTLLEVLNRRPVCRWPCCRWGRKTLSPVSAALPAILRILAGIIANGNMRQIDVVSQRAYLLPDGRRRLRCGRGASGPRRRRGHITRFTYGLPIVQMVLEYRFPPIEVEVLDSGERFWGAMVFVFNVLRGRLGPAYRGGRFGR